MQPKALPDLLAVLAEHHPLVYHFNELYESLPALRAQATHQPAAAWAGYQAFTAQKTMGLLQSCCFLPVAAQQLLDTYGSNYLVFYLAGLTYHYLAQLPANGFISAPNLTSFKQFCQAFIPQYNSQNPAPSTPPRRGIPIIVL